MKRPGTSKEDYIKENGRLREVIEMWEVKDRQVRENLTQILRYYPRESIGAYNSKPAVMTWLDIAFAMGELRADANYSMLLEGREMMRNEIEELKKQLEIKNKPSNV